MKNLGNLMKQAQQMQSKMTEMQKSLESLDVTGESGAGAVKITLNGKGELKTVHIEPRIVDPEEVEILEDLVAAAFRDAKKKVEELASSEMSKLTGGLPLPPGMKLPF